MHPSTPLDSLQALGSGGDDETSDRDEIATAQQHLVQACASAKLRPRQGEALTAFLRRQTHIYLQEKGISGRLNDDIPALVPNASVLYAYGNKLTNVSALSHLPGLRMLYLQDNRLSSISQLGSLTALQKLDVDGNCIQHVSGLEGLRLLSVLHISRQSLPDVGALSFDAATLQGLSSSLTTLRAACSGMNCISGLRPLQALQIADFSRNALTDPTDCLCFVAQATQLVDLDLRENPVISLPKFLDQVITLGDSVQCLNGSNVKAETRAYLHQLAKRRVRVGGAPTGSNGQGTRGGGGDHGALGAAGSAIHFYHHHSSSAHSGSSWHSGSSDSSRHPTTAAQPAAAHTLGLRMECVGAGLHQPSGIKEDHANGYVRMGLQVAAGTGFHMDEAIGRMAASGQWSGHLPRAQTDDENGRGGAGAGGKVSVTAVKAVRWR
eukprot:jgi/Ulvmu1/9442/UM052_0006.1